MCVCARQSDTNINCVANITVILFSFRFECILRCFGSLSCHFIWIYYNIEKDDDGDGDWKQTNKKIGCHFVCPFCHYHDGLSYCRDARRLSLRYYLLGRLRQTFESLLWPAADTPILVGVLVAMHLVNIWYFVHWKCKTENNMFCYNFDGGAQTSSRRQRPTMAVFVR